MKLKNNNLFINPQGLGDIAIPLKYFFINFLKQKKFFNYFIIQYSNQKDILKYYNKTNINFLFSSKFYNFNYSNILEILNFRSTKFDNIFFDPNIKIYKAILLSLLFRSKKKFYKQFLFYQIFFSKSPKFMPSKKIEYYVELNKYFFDKTQPLNFSRIKKKTNIIGIAPGSGNLESHRRWNYVNYIKLINNLKINIDQIYLFGTEKKILENISKNIKYKCKIISYRNINKSLKFLSNINFLITNDNGIANFAAIYNIKSYILCGPSIPHSIKSLDNINIITKKMSCSPCYPKLRLGCGNPKCLSELNYLAVLKKINQ